jgi:hypothetical protein
MVVKIDDRRYVDLVLAAAAEPGILFAAILGSRKLLGNDRSPASRSSRPTRHRIGVYSLSKGCEVDVRVLSTTAPGCSQLVFKRWDRQNMFAVLVPS